MIDVAIAGGGPAGLAAAICAGKKNFFSLVLERSTGPADKACGEGLMPSGARELEKLGVHVEESQRFRGIRYLQDGLAVEARFRDGDGLGIRRTVLSRALADRARECGAEIRRATVQGVRQLADRVELTTDQGLVEARLLIAADGLHSPLRRAAGLEAPLPKKKIIFFSGGPRFGIRRHFEIEPWSDMVEVHWADRVEAYVTPVGPRSVNVAFLGEKGSDFNELLAHFPALRERLAGVPAASEIRGAGPLLQRVRALHSGRMVLLGDAAGYVDAITGQGLSLAFAGAALLFDKLPPRTDLARDLAPQLAAYGRDLRPRWLRYALPARALVALSGHPALRRAAIRSVAAIPGAFGALVRMVG